MVQWIKRAYQTVAKWILEQGFRNFGWVAAFVFCWFFGSPILVKAGFLFLGIFIEKNRTQLVKIWKELKDKEIFNKIKG